MKMIDFEIVNEPAKIVDFRIGNERHTRLLRPIHYLEIIFRKLATVDIAAHVSYKRASKLSPNAHQTQINVMSNSNQNIDETRRISNKKPVSNWSVRSAHG